MAASISADEDHYASVIESLKERINSILPGLDWQDSSQLRQHLKVDIEAVRAVLIDLESSAFGDQAMVVYFRQRLNYMCLR